MWGMHDALYNAMQAQAVLYVLGIPDVVTAKPGQAVLYCPIMACKQFDESLGELVCLCKRINDMVLY